MNRKINYNFLWFFNHLISMYTYKIMYIELKHVKNNNFNVPICLIICWLYLY